MKKRSMFRELAGELVGTLILVLLGVGVSANVSLSPRLQPEAYNWHTIVLGWGLGYGIAIFLVSRRSLAHINPAVTLALAVKRDFPWEKVLPYFLAQVSGAILGAAAVWFMYKDGLFPAGLPNVWATHPGNIYETAFRIDASSEPIGTYRVIVACVAELLGSILLVWGYLASREVFIAGKGKFLAAGIIGLVVLAVGVSLGGPSGFAINPARDLGPRLWGAWMGTTGLFQGSYWLVAPVLTPLGAGPLGVLLFDWLIKEK